jgi:hypothetical protein
VDDDRFAIENYSSLPSFSTPFVPPAGVGDHHISKDVGKHGTQHCVDTSNNIASMSLRATEDNEFILHFLGEGNHLITSLCQLKTGRMRNKRTT